MATSPVKQTGKKQPSRRKAASNEPAEQTSGRRQKTVAGKGFGKPADVEDKLAAALLRDIRARNKALTKQLNTLLERLA